MPKDDVPPSFLTSAVDAVLGDLQQPTPIDLDVSFSRARREDQDTWEVRVRERGDRAGAVFVVEPHEAGEAFLARFADYLQEQFFPETRQARGQARPLCPGHTYPAGANLDEGPASRGGPVLSREGTTRRSAITAMLIANALPLRAIASLRNRPAAPTADACLEPRTQFIR